MIVNGSHPVFEQIDRKTSVANMLFSGGLKDVGDDSIAPRLTALMRSAKEDRLKTVGSGAALVILKAGSTASFAPSHVRELEQFAVCFDAVPEDWKDGLSRGEVSALIAALGVTLPKLIGVEKVSEAIVFFRDDGKPVFTFRFIMGRARAYVSSPVSAEDVTRVKERFRQIEAEPSLDRVVRLWHSALEKGDNLRAFLSSWNGLEIFIGKVFNEYEALTFDGLAGDLQRSSIQRYLRRIRDVMKDKYRLTDRFGLVAAHLSPSESDVDFATFSKAKDDRDSLSHGQDVDEDELPVLEVQALTRKYLRLHLERRAAIR